MNENKETIQESEKVYLYVPINKKDDVKNRGGKWDAEKKQWWMYKIDENKDIIKLYCKEPKKIYLDVPYEQKERAKKLGTIWDSEAERWYIIESDRNKIPSSWFIPKEKILLSKWFKSDILEELDMDLHELCEYDYDVDEYFIYKNSPNYKKVLKLAKRYWN